MPALGFYTLSLNCDSCSARRKIESETRQQAVHEARKLGWRIRPDKSVKGSVLRKAGLYRGEAHCPHCIQLEKEKQSHIVLSQTSEALSESAAQSNVTRSE